MNLSLQIPVYKTELFCMTTMIDLIVHPRIRVLDMNKLPKILRTHVTSRLHVSFCPDFLGICSMINGRLYVQCTTFIPANPPL